jgi:Flp pilus assembly protein TadB
MTRVRAWRSRSVRPVIARAGAMLVCVATLLGLSAGAASGAGAPAQTSAPTVMILLDNNSSQYWLPIAQRVALAYIGALPRNVRAGLITFASGWHLLLPPTTDRSRLDAAVDAVQGAGGNFYRSTGIYSALAGVTSAVPGVGRLVVISDAENLVARSLTATILTDVIAERLDDDDYVGRLTGLASRSGGVVVHPGQAAELAKASFGVPTKPRPTPQLQARAPEASSGASPRLAWSLVAGLAAFFTAVLLIALTALGWVARIGRDRELAGRIGRYGPRHKPVAEEEATDAGRVGRTAQHVAKRLMPPVAEERLAERLDLAGIARKPAEWALLGGCLGIVIAAVLSLVTSYVLLGVLVGALLGWLTMRMTLSMRIVRRRVAFGEQLPDMLQLVASALQSGFSLAQALDAVVREDAQPIAGEFSRALAEARLGGNLQDGLDAVATRMNSDDLHWTVMAIRIQEGVGGNLAEVLLTIAATIRERGYLRRQVRALSAEGRLSAYVLIALPLVVSAWLFIGSHGYMRPLYTTHLGELLLLIAAVLVVVGTLWMRKIIRIEI